MKIDLTLLDKDIRRIGAVAERAEMLGHDGIWATESGTDPFIQSATAVAATSTVGVGTAIAVAFARTPMTVAYTAWDLAALSGGRFVLGLGTQVKPHVERRYSMPWGRPAAQMREFIDATRAIFQSWRTGERLNFHGEYYTHDLMAPFWTPAPHDHEIPIHIAAVGPLMTELAGERADGVFLHAFTNQAFIRGVSLPALDQGIATAGRNIADVQVSVPLIMIMGDTEEQLRERRMVAARQIAFYGSTPSYRLVLEAIGYGDLQAELAALVKREDWNSLDSSIDDTLLGHFSITGTPEQMPALAREHLGERVQRTSSYFGWPDLDPDRLSGILNEFDQQSTDLQTSKDR